MPEPAETVSPGPTYEQARDELGEIVRRLETGAATLEESLALWERGEALAVIAQQWLDGARVRLDRAVAGEGAGTRIDDEASGPG